MRWHTYNSSLLGQCAKQYPELGTSRWLKESKISQAYDFDGKNLGPHNYSGHLHVHRGAAIKQLLLSQMEWHSTDITNMAYFSLVYQSQKLLQWVVEDWLQIFSPG